MSSIQIGRLQRWKLAIEDYFAEKPFFVPEHYTWQTEDGDSEETEEKREYLLTPIQRFFVMLQEPSSSILAGWVSNFVLTVILVNVVCNVYMTLPGSRNYPVTTCPVPACSHDPVLCPGTIMCPPTTDPFLVRIDDICVIIFSIEYVSRLSTVWTVPMRLAGLVNPQWDEEEQFCARHEERAQVLEPPQKWYGVMWSYIWQGKNLIDVVAIIPFYVTLANPDADASLSFIRVLRLFRIVRAFNINASSGVTSLIIKTVTESMEVIMLLLFFSAMIILIYGSIIFDAEMGTYTVDADNKNGVYLRQALDGSMAESPFSSALVGMYWAVITMTTVGYGDIYPVSDVGRTLAVTCAFVGVLFMALPISILGANFTVQYQRLSESQRIERKKRATLLLSKKLEHFSGKEIKVDVDYEVAKSMVKEDKKKGANPKKTPVRKISTNAIGGQVTITGNRIADMILSNQAKSEEAREALIRQYEMVPIASGDEDLPSGGTEGSVEPSHVVLAKTRSTELENDLASSADESTKALVAMMQGKCPDEKKQILIDMAANMSTLAASLQLDLEVELQRTVARYREMSESVSAFAQIVSTVLAEEAQSAIKK